MGGAARGDGLARRPGGPVALRPARGAGRPRRIEPRAGGGARAPQPPGHRAAQRPAERDLDDWQLPHRDPCARVRQRRAEAGVHRACAAARGRPRVRPHRAGSRLRRHAARDHGAPRGRGMGARRHQAFQLRHAPCQPRPGVCAHVGLPGRAARHHRVHRPARRAGAGRAVLLVDVQHADRPR